MARSEKEILQQHKLWQRVLQEALMPLISQDGKHGITAMRVFYTMRDNVDGVLSVGQAGITPEGNVEDGEQLIRSMIAVLLDPDDNRTVERIATPERH